MIGLFVYLYIETIVVSYTPMIISILVFLILLSILVLIHELGHFIVARKLGIKVEEFGFGFPPKLWSIRRGETEYSINWLPIGGFVKLYGEDEAGAGRVSTGRQKEIIKDKDRAFFSKTPWQRAAVVVAGVVMNAVLAIVIFYVFLIVSNFKVELPLLSSHQFLLVNQKTISDVIVTAVAKNSPAEKAGIKPYVKIIEVNGERVPTTKEFTTIVNKNKGKEVTVVWQDIHTKKKSRAVIVPRVSPPPNQGAIGVAFVPVDTVMLSYDTPLQKILSGIVHPVNLMMYNFDVLGDFIKVSIEKKTTEPLSQSVSGPVGIYSLVGKLVEIPDMKEKILQILNLAGILSISLAFFNILHIPALDGGRLFFILIEAVTGKKVNQRFESTVHTVGMVVLLGFLLFITISDVQKLFFNALPSLTP